MRNIDVDGIPFTWKMGRSHVQIRDVNNRGYYVTLTTLTGWTWEEIEKAKWKGGFAVTPKAISDYIRKNILQGG